MLEKAMLAGEDIAAIPELASHAEWANQILADYPDFAEPNARQIIEKEVGKVFMEVLEDAGVFKRTEEGRSGFMRFVEAIVK